MNAKTACAAAVLFGSTCGVLTLASAPASAQRAFCASGYHADKQGNCQPNNPQPNLQPCPPGFLSAPAPTWSSYTCVPIPKGY